MCGKHALHPTAGPQRAAHLEECSARHERLAARARSEGVECGICLERVLEKQPVPFAFITKYMREVSLVVLEIALKYMSRAMSRTMRRRINECIHTSSSCRKLQEKEHYFFLVELMQRVVRSSFWVM